MHFHLSNGEGCLRQMGNFVMADYDLNSSKEERDILRTKRRKEYEKLRRQCRRLLKSNDNLNIKETGRTSNSEDGGTFTQSMDSADSEDVVSARESLSSEDMSPSIDYSNDFSNAALDRYDGSKRITDPNTSDTESSDSDSSVEVSISFSSTALKEENDPEMLSSEDSSSNMENRSNISISEDFATWQRIIRLDAIRANEEWQAPPTEDLLLYAVAASVLQKRKLIIEKYSSMDEIIKECNGMAGHLDVWKLLDDAHNLVVTLHNKIENPLPGIA
uniref:Uncharacterized protein n=1 Tax=Daucus carota subsp. sativus TaxID=79200 RepID=A0A161ZVZ7_DAUCS